MTKLLSTQTTRFEEAFKAISLSTWNRPRTSSELQSFLARREEAVRSVEL